MNAALIFLVTGAVFALIGTVLRGIIRPISWATLAVAATLAAIDQSVNSAQNNTSVQVSPPTATSSAPPPEAVPGWQNVANLLESTVAQALDPNADPATVTPLDPPVSDDVTVAADPSPSPSVSPAPSTAPASRPIQGFW